MTENKQDQVDIAPHSAVDELVAKSASTDIHALLSAKESAKRAVLDNASQTNLAALERATKMLNAATQGKSNIGDWGGVMDYVAENGRKLGKTKLFEDIKRGLLKKQPDGTFRLRDIDRYMAGLPTLGTSDSVAKKAAERQLRREEEEIRRIKAAADKEEFLLAVKKREYIARNEIYEIFGARAVALSSYLKIHFESNALDIIEKVGGNPKKVSALLDSINAAMDEAFNDYVSTQDFEVIFKGEGEDENMEGNGDE